MILDKQPDEVLKEINASWDAQLAEFLEEEEYQVPMPALAVSAVRKAKAWKYLGRSRES